MVDPTLGKPILLSILAAILTVGESTETTPDGGFSATVPPNAVGDAIPGRGRASP